LRVLLRLDETNADTGRAIVLAGTSPAAIIVDAVEALLSVAEDRVEIRRGELAAEPGERITGAFPVDGGRVAKILDVPALLNDAFAKRAKSSAASPSRAPVAKARDDEATKQAAVDVLVTFDVADQEYALPLSAVLEIVAAPEKVTRMPRGEALVIGVMPFRDRLLPLVSLRGLLGVPAAAAELNEKIIVASVGGALVGLVADGARAIVSAERDRIDPLPAVLAARTRGEARIKAIYRGNDGQRLISILATEQLFHADVMQRLAVSEGFAVDEHAPSVAERQFLVFRLGADEFGLPIEAVDEVASVPERITRVPKTPKFLEGVVNLRGEILPVVDQRRRFDMPPAEQADTRRLLVVRTERHRAGLIVDSVRGVMRSSEDAIEPPPDLTGDITRLMRGVVNLPQEGRIVLLLDPAELLTRAERGMLDAMITKSKSAS